MKPARINSNININFNLRNTTPTNKLTTVRCIVRFNNKKIVLSSPVKIEPRHWNIKKQEARNNQRMQDGTDINKKTKSVIETIETVFKDYVDKYKTYPDPVAFKELVLQHLQTNKPAPVIAVVNDIISFTGQFIKECETGLRLTDKGSPLNENTIKSYRTFRANLVDFKSKSSYNMSFENINTNFFELFKEYLTFTMKYATNTLGKRIRILKTIMNEAKERGLTTSEFRGSKYKAITESIDSIYLNKSELETLFKLDLSKKPKLDRVRDLFLVGCWTGLRFSDYHNIKPENIRDGFLHIRQQKTGNDVVVPIHDVVYKIMEKYQGKTNNSLPPTITNQKMNGYLKDIGKLADFNDIIKLEGTKAGKRVTQDVLKHTQISTHTARRSFATNAYHDNVPSLVIMAITGHRTESSFMKYIKVTPMEQAKKLKELWSLSTISHQTTITNLILED